MVKLELFVAGTAVNSAKALANLKRVLDRIGAEVDLKVVDVLHDPMQAVENSVLVTPLLLRHHPQPGGALLGSMDDEDQVLAFIGLAQQS